MIRITVRPDAVWFNVSRNNRSVSASRPAHRLVQDQDRGIGEQRAGQSQPTALAARKPGTALAHPGVEPIGKGADNVADLGGIQGLPQRRVVGIGAGEQQVGSDRIVEQVRILTLASRSGHGRAPRGAWRCPRRR